LTITLFRLYDRQEEWFQRKIAYSLRAMVIYSLWKLPVFRFQPEELFYRPGLGVLAIQRRGESCDHVFRGRDLGQRILEARNMDRAVKLAAAMALFNIGVYKENEPVTMILDGKEVKFAINQVMMSFELDEEVREMLPMVKKLKGEGRYKEALTLLENLPQNKKFHPQPLIVMANLYRDLKELGKAEEILLLLLNVLPKDPVVLFNLVGLSLQKKDLQQGRSYFDQLDLNGLDDEFKQKVDMLGRHIENMESEMRHGLPFWNVEEAVSTFEEAQRNKMEEKTLPRDAGLSRGLKNMPAIWLDGMLDYYDLDCSGKRQEKEKIVADFLSQKTNLAATLKDLDKEEVELVQFLLSKGGWARLNIVSRKFGSMEGSGFHWNEENPDSPLAFLWSIGLVMVGRTIINERRCKIAVIPVELREHLQSLLGSQ
jgi:tetratricopeptide (TPR) repeat protein